MPDVPGLDVSGLQAWLHRAHPELQGDQLSARVVAGGKSNLTYAIDGGSIPLILRRPPLGHVLSSAHDMRREFRVISAVHGTGVPVPVAIDVVDDTDARQVTGTTFLLMERAPGLALSHASAECGVHRLGTAGPQRRAGPASGRPARDRPDGGRAG